MLTNRKSEVTQVKSSDRYIKLKYKPNKSLKIIQQQQTANGFDLRVGLCPVSQRTLCWSAGPSLFVLSIIPDKHQQDWHFLLCEPFTYLTSKD